MISLIQLALVFVFPAIMIFAAAYDLLTMTIPNRLSIALALAFFVIALIVGMDFTEILMNTGAGLLVLAVGIGFFAAGWVGGGDVKLAAGTVLWLGFDLVLPYLFVAALAGGVLTVVILMLRRHPLPAFAQHWAWLDRLHDARNGVPYGVALAVGAIMTFPETPIWLAAFSS